MPFAQELGIGKPQLNMFGEPITKPLWLRTAGRSIISWPNPEPVYKWMTQTGYRITEQGPVIHLNETEQKTYGELNKTYAGYKDVLTPEQSYKVLQKAGPQIKAYLDTIRTSPAFQVYSKPMQDNIDAYVVKVRARARLEVLLRR